MSSATTVLHVAAQPREAVEAALRAIFHDEGRDALLRVEGTFSAVRARVLDEALPATYRYLICRPHAASRWTPVLEVGNRTEGLDVELSRRLEGADIIRLFAYGGVVSGYRVVRGGALVDQYLSDPEALDELASDEVAAQPQVDVEAWRGHPQRFADLLPEGTTPEEFVRVVLAPGWWEEHDAGTGGDARTEDDVVDEADRMRCIALAYELGGPTEYPFAAEVEEIADRAAGPAIGLAFA